MLRTTTVTALRADLSSQIENLSEGPILILSRSKPKAMLMDVELYENLLERIELIEDILDGRQVISEYRDDPGSFVDADEIFNRLGL
ncbi:MAG: type II toxin-antitoxin system Phd/YefM family antitoxin [Anaerolineales bacterium]|nr:type II toxin-antitoxin system Phd/YefM family antitoxin [Anaerolineales bacterium]